MKKILSLAITAFCFVGMYAQLPDSVQTADTKTESGLKTVVDYLLENKKFLNIKLDTRFDYQGVFTDKETEQSSFRGQTLKLVFEGEITPGIRYKLRQRLNKPQNPSERDNLAGATDLAYIEFDAGKKWTFRAGKQFIQLGTFEYDYNPADVYVPSMCYDDFDSYKTGINVAYKAGKQVFNLQVVNSDAPQFAADKYKNKVFAGLFLWEGNLFDGLLKTRYGYSIFQHDASKYYSWYTLGTELNVNKFTADFDWYMGNRNMDFNSLVPSAVGNREVRDQSLVVNLRYTIGKFKPLLQGNWNKRRDQATGANYMIKGIQGGFEYFPFTDPMLKDLQFHAVYAYNNTDFNGDFRDLKGINKNYVIVGMRWLLKVM